MSASISPLTRILDPAARAGYQAFNKLQGPVNVLPKTGINTFFQNLFKGVTPAASKAVQVTTKATIPKTLTGISKNVIVGGGTILGTTALLSLTSGGQNLVNTSGKGISDITNLGGSFNNLLKSNPLIPIGLIVLGGLVVMSVLKK